jgi:hypothetical protein
MIFSSPQKSTRLKSYPLQGAAYLQTPDYTVNTLVDTHPDRPMTLYKGPHSLFRALAPKYRLNKAEYLQLYNLRPTTQVMLDLIIEEVRSSPPRESVALFATGNKIHQRTEYIANTPM